MRVKKRQNPRIIFLIVLMLSVFMVFGFRTADFQITTAGEFASKNANLTSITTQIKATRGVIVDRYGRPIAINRDGYNVVFNSAYLKKKDYNSTIITVARLLSSYGYTWNDILPMSNESPYSFSGEETAVLSLKTKLGLNSYATAENCFDEMVERYALEAYPYEDKRIIMGVRYSMERADFSVSNPYTFAEDISSELMMVISESYSNMPGIEIEVVTYREYTDPTLAPHVIGTIGKISSSDEWNELKDKGYSYNDYLGKSGIEKACEDYLKGEDGELTYYFDKSGNVVFTEVTKESVQGDTVFLTIDSKLQKVTQEALANNIESLNAAGSKITGGAAVVMSVKTGEVLASANYPSYNIDDYYSNYSSVLNSANNPLFDRAFTGKYPPGSAFKPLVAIAGLQEKVIDRYTTIYCKRKYTYYEDYQPNCMHYHGSVNVISAISQSCNYFFFDVGRQVGITKLNSYATKFGFGGKTGIELPETAGTLAGPAYSASIGNTWFAGLTLSAAIGQSDNAFSPLQLAVYTSTIANGGTRYKSTLVNSVRTSVSNESIYRMSPLAVDTVGADADVMSIVKQGMRSVTSEGTASAYFSNYPIAVGGKTGTAQTTGLDNSVLIVFAPYEDPEIAISIVIEHGEKSTSTGPVAKTILDAYFFGETDYYEEEAPNQLLD